MSQRFDAEQRKNAATIISVGRSLGATPTDIIVALMTALQESSLHNDKYGDRDSLGVFQQRPSQGWGTAAQVMNVQYAATQFYKRLLAEKGHSKLPLTLQAQSVQRSAYPDAYAKHEGAARMLYASISGDKSLMSTITSDASKVVGVLNPATGPATLAAGALHLPDPVSGAVSATKSLGKAAQIITSRDFWIRAAYVMAGVFALILGVMWLNRKNINTEITSAAKVAAVA